MNFRISAVSLTFIFYSLPLWAVPLRAEIPIQFSAIETVTPSPLLSLPSELIDQVASHLELRDAVKLLRSRRIFQNELENYRMEKAEEILQGFTTLMMSSEIVPPDTSLNDMRAKYILSHTVLDFIRAIRNKEPLTPIGKLAIEAALSYEKTARSWTIPLFLGSGSLQLKLVQAAESDPRLLSGIIHHGISVDTRNGNGESALMLASASGSFKAMRILLENGACPNTRDDFGFTSAHYLFRSIDTNIAQSRRTLISVPFINLHVGGGYLNVVGMNPHPEEFYLQGALLLSNHGADFNVTTEDHLPLYKRSLQRAHQLMTKLDGKIRYSAVSPKDIVTNSLRSLDYDFASLIDFLNSQ